MASYTEQREEGCPPSERTWGTLDLWLSPLQQLVRGGRSHRQVPETVMTMLISLGYPHCSKIVLLLDEGMVAAALFEGELPLPHPQALPLMLGL